jgi:hypothetical protein
MRGQEGENGMTLEIQPKNFKAAAIVFVVVNSISVLIALFSIVNFRTLYGCSCGPG